MQAAAKPVVLVVDDNEQKRYTIVRYLKAAGYDVIETTTGAEAIHLAQSRPAAIALDVNLPDIVGYEVARRLREDPKTAGIPIIHISATFTTPNSIAHGLNSGADTYLTGPIEPEQLIATMNAMMRIRKAEAEARDFAARWQATFDAISDAVLLVNADGVIERANRAFCTLVDRTVDKVVGRNLSEVAGSAAVDQSVYFRMLGSRHREAVERSVEDAWFSISADPVVDSIGTFMGGVVIISNITDRKNAEEARRGEQELLQKEAVHLEAKVLERTRQLEESVRSMEGFCYTIAHDLRAPLRAVNGLTSELVEQYAPQFDEEGKLLAGRITAAAKRMDRLIEELLAFGRLSNDNLPRRNVDLDLVFKAAIIQLGQDIAGARADVKVEGTLPHAWANPTIVEQIAVNLIGNALKFVAPSVTPKVVIRAEMRDNKVRFWVADNGIGIEPAYQKKVFGLFERLHSDKQYRGTGIGLAIVQKGVERMNGAAGVESTPGKGSQFWVELPARENA